MSFQTLKKDLLVQVAEDFGVELEDDATKAQIIAALAEDGVTWDLYKEAFPDEKDQEDAEPKAEPVAEEKKSVVASKLVLVKMERENGHYETRGYTFTREHPFLPVTEDDASYLVEYEEGFRIASPKEAQEYYS